MSEWTCAGCDERSSEAEEWTWLGQKMFCSSCAEQERARSSVVVRVGPEGAEAVRFGDDWAEDAETGEEPPVWFTEHFRARRWIRTDPWRGHYETPHSGLAVVASGWLTGWVDETVGHKRLVVALYADLRDEKLRPPVNVYWLLEPTSNVFSMAADLLVSPEDEEIFKAWLEEAGYPVEKVVLGFH